MPGTKIEKADKLSKKLDQKVCIEKDNENQTLIKEEQICNLAEGLEVEKIKIARYKDEESRG